MKTTKKGFTLIELLVVIAIIAILASILFPVFARARDKARQTTCTSNVKQMVISAQMYAQDHDEVLPGSDWQKQLPDAKILYCPNKKDGGYAYNTYLQGFAIGTLQDPTNVIAFFDADESLTMNPAQTRHSNGAVYGRADGSVVCVKTSYQAGHMAVGLYPINPIHFDTTGNLVAQRPSTFVSDHDGGTADKGVTNEFTIVGPYGDNIITGNAQTDTEKGLDTDYIGESKFSLYAADISPIPGDGAPGLSNMVNPSVLDSTAPLPSGPASPKQFKKWSIVDTNLADDLGTGVYPMYKVLGSLYFGRSCYAATYLFSPVAQDVRMYWWCDDIGKVWINGSNKAKNGLPLETRIISGVTDLTGLTSAEYPANPPTPATQGIISLPQGISYILVKTTNRVLETADGTNYNNAGGMKFKLKFTDTTGNPLATGNTLYFSNSPQ
jgi:prepilin-type N-terminal cleavage/methylation domain-containing protein